MNYLKVAYDENKKPFTKYPDDLINYLVKKFNLKTHNKKLLDIACGRGEFVHSFKKKGFDCYAFDGDQSYKKDLIKLGINFKKLYFKKKLPYKNNSFDLIFCKSFIEHIREPDTLIKECYRILKKNGVLILLTPDFNKVYKTFYHDYTHVSPFTIVSCKDILASCNFKQIHSEIFYQLPFLWKYKFLKIFILFIDIITKEKFEYNSKIVKFSKETMILAYGVK